MAQNQRRNRLKKIGKILSFFILLIFTCGAAADRIDVKATVDRNSMRPGDSFTYTISISSEGSASFDKPTLPALNDFEVLNTWSGSEMRGTFINGQMQTQRSQTFNYMLSATKEGRFTIGAAEVVVNGQVMRTNPIQIEVSASAAQAPSLGQNQDEDDAFQPGAPPPGMNSLEEEMFSQLLRRRARPGLPQGKGFDRVNDNDVFFIHVETDKDTVYQGEQIIASWYLLSKAQIADIDTLRYPALSGFWKEDIEVATRLNFQPQIINGMHYQKALLASYALFPIKEGVSTVDRYQAKCRAIGVNSMGFPQEVQLTKESNEIKIKVLPLPTEGRPESFTGGVGQYTATATIDVNSVNVNTPITLKLRIEGKGNAKGIDMPKLNLANEIQVYDTKSESKFFTTGRSYKEFETLIVPKAAGRFTIPPIEISFFDTEKKAYYTQKTNEISFEAKAGSTDDLIPAAKMQADIEPEKAEEKKPTLPGVILNIEEHKKVSLAQQTALWSLLFTLSIAGLTIFGIRETRTEVKRKDLRKQIDGRISDIEQHIAKDDWRRAGREATNLIYFALGEVANLGGASFEFDRLVERAPPSFKRTIAPKLKEVMTKAEAVGFAPEDIAKRYKDKNELKKLIKEIQTLLVEAAKYDFTSIEKESSDT